MKEEETKNPSIEKLGIHDTAQDSHRLNGYTFEEVLNYVAKNVIAFNANKLDGLSVGELLEKVGDPVGRVLDAERLADKTLDDVMNEVKNRIREASHPYVVLPLSRGGYSRLVTIPGMYTNEYGGNKTTDEDLVFLLIGGGPYGFLSERPVAYLRIGREGRPPVVNVLSGRYTVDFFYRKVKTGPVADTEIWCGDAARNDIQIVLLGGIRGCQFGVKDRPQEEKPEGDLVPIRRESVVHYSLVEKTVAELRSEINVIKSEIAALQPTK